MSSPRSFYTAQKASFEGQLASIKKMLVQSSIIRLLVFCAMILVIYFFYENAKLWVPMLAGCIILFFYLIHRHANLSEERDKILALIAINQTELDVLDGDISGLASGKEFKQGDHYYSYDLDLFEDGSFFQYVNRTVLPSGKQALAASLASNETHTIEAKQRAVQELAAIPIWRQDFAATGSLVNVEVSSDHILNWLQNHKSFVPKSMRYIPQLFLGVSLLIFVLNYLSLAPLSVTVIWLFVGISITGVYLKSINQLYLHSNKAKDTFKQYYQLLERIEKTDFSSEILQNQQSKINTETKKASQIFKDFSKLLDAFDQRNNMMIGVFANGYALRDLQLCYRIEQWMATYADQVEKWFEVIAFFDAQNSFANYTFNHPEFIFPKLSTNTEVIRAKALGHPVLDKEKRIDNDFTIEQGQFFIITGANMAGKSTFLRTVSLAIVMANVGLPVCAKSFDYTPKKLITSMRTSDSLTNDESYFFSELKRLKMIVDALNSEEDQTGYFIILDEILKGTNSEDKAKGSKKFIEKLVASNAMGIIATHDLSLCEVATELPQVKNYYFDAEISNDLLHFDYLLKIGVCQNMNASFLLNKMGIV